MAVVLFLTSIVSPMRTYIMGNFSLAVDLPFHLCGISALICAVIPFLKSPEYAINHFQNFYNNVGYPISLARGAYWLGESYEQLNEKENANWHH